MSRYPLQSLVKVIKSAYTRKGLSGREYIIGVVEAGVLAGSLFIGAIIGENCSSYRYSRIPTTQAQTEADKLFDEFPLEVKGSKKVVKYGERNSSHCLVHIRQTHFLDIREWREKMEARNFPEGRIKAEIEEIESLENTIVPIMNDIATMVEDLHERLSITHVYPEGTEDDEAQWFNELRPEIRNKYLEMGDGIFEDAKEKIGNDIAKILFYDIKSTGNAILEERTTESREILDEAAEKTIGFFLDGGGDMNTANSEREDFLLNQISSSEDKLAVTIFGAWHNWRDNVDRWNKEHPNDKFSLIEVVPQSYK